MRPRDRAHGKITDHFAGVGTVTREMVVQRAKELALINGRDPNHFTHDDFLAAKQELVGESAEDEPVAALTRWDEEPGTTGHAVEKMEPPDEQVETERIFEEGMSEAEHEHMVEGAKAQTEQER